MAAELYLEVTARDETLNMTNMTSFRSIHARHPGILLYEHFTPKALWFSRVLFVVWLAVGIPGNILSAKVWLEGRMRNSSAIYVAALSINCVVFLVMHIGNALKYQWGLAIYHYPVVCELYNVVYTMTQYLNQLLILGLTVDRYIAVCFPLRRRDLCRPSRAFKVVLGMIVASTMVASVLYYYKLYDPALKECINRQPLTTAMQIWTFSTELTFSLIGPVATLVLNALVIIGVRNARRVRRVRELEMSQCRGVGGAEAGNRHSASVVRSTPEATVNSKSPQHKSSATKTVTTATLLTISFFYVITTLPATLLHLTFQEFEQLGNVNMTDDEIANDPGWTKYFAFRQLEMIIYELSVPHYVINLFIFLPTGRHFREAIVDSMLCRRRAAAAGVTTL